MKIFKKKEKEEKKVETEDVESESSNNVSASVDSANNLHIILDTNNNTNNSEDKKEKRKKIYSWSLKITLLLVVAFLISWCVYSFILLFSEGENNIHSYILLDGKNFSQSQNVYSSFAKNDQSKSKKNKINDYYLVGNQLFVSESNLNSSIYTDCNSTLSDSDSNIALYNLTYDEPYSFSSSTSISDKRYSIDLNLLSQGDYLIYSRNNNEGEKNRTSDYYPYSINTSESIYFETYSLPNKNGSRRKITVKNNSVSPYTVISSFNAGSVLPSNYYDAVIYQAEYDTSLNNQSKSVDFVSEIENIISSFNSEVDNIYSIKVCSSINEARTYHAPISIAILNNEDNIKLCSKYVEGYYPSFSTSLLENTTLVNYDKYPDIREMFGLIDKATLAYKDVIGNNLFKLDYSHVGKESFILSKNLLASNYKTIFERTQEV